MGNRKKNIIENVKLYVCPYDKVVGCSMKDGCLGCEIFDGVEYKLY